MVVEGKNRDGVAFNIDSIKHNERSLGDPHLVDVAIVNVFSRVGARREELKEKLVDAREGALSDRSPETINSELKLTSDVGFDACREDDFHGRLKLKRVASLSNASPPSMTSPRSACAMPSSSCARWSDVMRP